jgi:imidazolonepropionase-like amidohydrolase
MEDYMTWWKTMFGMCLVILGSTTMLWPQAPQVVAVRAGRLFDSKSGEMLANQVVLVSGDRITDVGPESRVKIPSGTRVIDLSRATVLPGLIDGHTHIFQFGLSRDQTLQRSGFESVPYVLHGGPPDVDPINDTREYRALKAFANADDDLKAGFTTLRDLINHGNGNANVDVRNAINNGHVIGPRMQVAGLVEAKAEAKNQENIGFHPTEGGALLPTQVQMADIPEQIRQSIRDQIHLGVDWIKFRPTAATHNFGPDGRVVYNVTYSLAEIQAIIDETHRGGKKAFCAVYGGESVLNCVKAGADTLDGAIDLDDETIINMIKEKGIFVNLSFFAATLGLEDDLKKTDGKFSIAALRNKSGRKIIESGIKIGFASGVGPFPHGSQALEFEYLVHYGMTAAQAIQSATVTAAEMLGWQDRIGSIEKGKYADIIAVAGDPLKDITELGRVKFVMKGGEVVRNDQK